MIKRIVIDNFQSHAHTEIEFSSKDTVIIGSSDCGKSSIFRAIEWVRTNRPRGTSFIRKGTDLLCRVELVVEGRDGEQHKIVRERQGDRINRYVIDDQQYTALGSGVPSEVDEILGIADVNVQAQLDQHFLVLSPPGQIAQYINGITKLEEADKVLSLLMGRSREEKRTLETLREILDGVEEKLKDPVFDFLEDFEAMLDRRDHLLDLCSKRRENLPLISGCISEIEKIIAKIQEAESFLKIRGDVERLCHRVDDYYSSAERFDRLFRGISEAEALSSSVIDVESTWRRVSAAEEKAQKLLCAVTDTSKCAARFELVVRLIEEVIRSDKLIEEVNRRLNTVSSEYESFVQDVQFCPVCEIELTEETRARVVENLT